MPWKLFAIGLFGAELVLASVGSASGLGLMQTRPGSDVGLGAPMHRVTFWAEPFPYGYSGWGQCLRYEREDTEWGLHFKRVNVCSRGYGHRRHLGSLRVKD